MTSRSRRMVSSETPNVRLRSAARTRPSRCSVMRMRSRRSSVSKIVRFLSYFCILSLLTLRYYAVILVIVTCKKHECKWLKDENRRESSFTNHFLQKRVRGEMYDEPTITDPGRWSLSIRDE